MTGEDLELDVNIFNKYAVQVLIPERNVICESQLKSIGEKFQDKNEFIIHNTLSDTRGNQIFDIIEEKDPLIPGKLYYYNWCFRS